MRLFKVKQKIPIVNTFGVTRRSRKQNSRMNAAASASTMCAAPDRQETQRRARPLWTRLRTTAGMVIAHGVRCAAPSVPGKEHDAAPAEAVMEHRARPGRIIAQKGRAARRVF
jgi:hypothetical protein